MTRLTLAGAIYITAVSILPEFLSIRMASAILFWRDIFADRCGRHYGFYCPGASASDVSTI